MRAAELWFLLDAIFASYGLIGIGTVVCRCDRSALSCLDQQLCFGQAFMLGNFGLLVRSNFNITRTLAFGNRSPVVIPCSHPSVHTESDHSACDVT
jgi:hypothetical protein